jgi:hypothetical protein
MLWFIPNRRGKLSFTALRMSSLLFTLFFLLVFVIRFQFLSFLYPLPLRSTPLLGSVFFLLFSHPFLLASNVSTSWISFPFSSAFILPFSFIFLVLQTKFLFSCYDHQHWSNNTSETCIIFLLLHILDVGLRLVDKVVPKEFRLVVVANIMVLLSTKLVIGNNYLHSRNCANVTV